MVRPSPTTLIDRVDDANRVVGQVERANALRESVNFRTVHSLVFTSAGQLVVQRIGRVGTRYPGLLGSSMAGYLFAGESYEDAARRRISDELGIDPPLTPLGVTSMRDESSIKFVGVFTAVADDARVEEPGHVEDLERWNLAELRRAMSGEPYRFTESFRHVIAFYDEVAGTLPS
jgi:isopentenyl-diphosphate delta-isomerase